MIQHFISDREYQKFYKCKVCSTYVKLGNKYFTVQTTSGGELFCELCFKQMYQDMRKYFDPKINILV